MENIEEEKITLAINKTIWDEFKKYCSVNAYKISRKIELLLKEEIEKGPKTKNLIEVFKEIIEKQKEEIVDKPVVEEAAKVIPYSNSLPTETDEIPPIANIVKPTLNKTDNPKMLGSDKKIPTIEELRIRKS